ncbi:DUF4873 domain-containing protein [Nocardiopsis sp. MG754419]|uniref:DUF4873 domain-containing protein n=1 Tax=Nocardiopsis sp. MG754419 TaxID=2259865 RepID=UPI001BA97246|nr:DUF4873 domain-containing protein [Nocardiopsis sp. MG754419]MBR8741164.1 DUF4873 domain-containing protein [Nocardiopsis sp. MG754419]
MSGFDDEEEYRGTVTVLLSEDATEGVEVGAHLAGHFSPLTGDYRWTGRLSAHPEVTRAYEDGTREVVLRTPDGYAGAGTLDGPNLWGGHPVNGAGTPPFAVPRIILEDD